MLRPGHLCLAAALAATVGCKVQQHGCLGGDDSLCVPPPPCPARKSLAGCTAPEGALRAAILGPEAVTLRPRGTKAAAAAGDYILENGVVRVFIDAIANPRTLAPSGGSIIDLTTLGGPTGDHLNAVFHAAGLLPRDAVRYRRVEILEGGVDFAAIVLRGHLHGNEKVDVVTRYEVRPCESGVRVRTELSNRSGEVNTFYLADGFFWGDRNLMPFVPLPGQGFRHPKVDLLELEDSWRRWPFVAARSQGDPPVGYAALRCRAGSSAGFNDPTLSAAGVELQTTLPDDGIALDRYIAVARGPGLAPVVGEALRARSDFFGERAPATVRGRVVTMDGQPVDGRGGRAASVLFYEPAAGKDPDDEKKRRPWSEAVPAANGQLTVDLPAGRRFRAQVYAFGRPAAPAVDLMAGAPGSMTAMPDIVVARPALVRVNVTDEAGMMVRFAELVLAPVDPAMTPGGSFLGTFESCQPLLGPPHGGSPACNRVLVLDGKAEFLAPPGRYFLYATRGPFSALAREEIDLAAGAEVERTLRVQKLPLLPPGVLSADFHVHGGASFDTAIPDLDRVASFLAAGVDVIAATDHDVVVDYRDALAALEARALLAVMPGVEATPNILWFRVPGETFPKTLGHFNFWPLPVQRTEARGGAPWDEELEPGALMDVVDMLMGKPGVGVRQMNHPWAKAKLGRDEGFLRVLGYDARTPLAAKRTFASDVLLRAPAGGRRNLDFDAQEVISGPSRRELVRNRAIWFSFLSQGLLKAGTANSDTHSLSAAPVGYGRTLVLPSHSVAAFDAERFNADVRAGRLVGTNGPVLHARVVDAAGNGTLPALTPLAGARESTVVVSVGAAPWIPVAEVRFVVNGRTVKTVPTPRLSDGADPFGLDRHEEVRVPVAELIAGVAGDAWLVVEAGLPLPVVGDLDPDGVPDTADNDGNGTVDARDVPKDDDGEAARFPDPKRPPSTDARFHLDVVAPGVWPYAFSNPFLLDLDGGGWKAP